MTPDERAAFKAEIKREIWTELGKELAEHYVPQHQLNAGFATVTANLHAVMDVAMEKLLGSNGTRSG